MALGMEVGQEYHCVLIGDKRADTAKNAAGETINPFQSSCFIKVSGRRESGIDSDRLASRCQAEPGLHVVSVNLVMLSLLSYFVDKETNSWNYDFSPKPHLLYLISMISEIKHELLSLCHLTSEDPSRHIFICCCSSSKAIT